MTSYSKIFCGDAVDIEDGWAVVRNGNENDVVAYCDTERIANGVMAMMTNDRLPDPPDFVIGEEYGEREDEDEWDEDDEEEEFDAD